MNGKYLFILILIAVYLLSCNGTKNKINDEKIKDSILINPSIKLTQGERKHKVIHFEVINIDSIIGNYLFLYKTQDNGQIVTTYPITDGKGKDTNCYACQDVFLIITKDSQNIILNRKIQRDDFSLYIPKDEISNYSLSNFSIKEIRNNETVFDISFCIPETDIYYSFELIVSDNGNVKINEVIDNDSDM